MFIHAVVLVTASTAEIEIAHKYEFSDRAHCQCVLVFSTPH